MRELQKIYKYLDKLDLKLESAENKIVVCSDSKGRYLKPFVPKIYQRNFIWYTKSGRSTLGGVKFIQNRLERLSKTNKRVTLVFWHGTCDITRKEGKFICLKNRFDSEVVGKLKRTYSKLIKITKQYPNIELCLLEIPPISVRIWNKTHDHDTWFLEDDVVVNDQVRAHNELIRSLNCRYVSPRFALDLLKSRSNKKSSKKINSRSRVRYSYNFFLLSDGVHPIGVVAKYWAFRIIENINRYL